MTETQNEEKIETSDLFTCPFGRFKNLQFGLAGGPVCISKENVFKLAFSDLFSCTRKFVLRGTSLQDISKQWHETL